MEGGLKFRSDLRTPPSSEEDESIEDNEYSGYQMLNEEEEVEEEEFEEEHPAPAAASSSSSQPNQDFDLVNVINEDELIEAAICSDVSQIEKNFAKFLPKSHSSTPHVLAAKISEYDGENSNGFDFEQVDFVEVSKVAKSIKLNNPPPEPEEK